jgi:hypothetical protein
MASAGGRPRAVGISPQAGTAEVSAARAWAIRAVLATAALALLAVFAASAHAAPAVSSGVSTQNGFPLWYQDAAGNRIEQCIDPADANCALVASDFFNPTLPIVFPSSGEACAAPVDPTKCNFPDEFFYASADSDRVQLPGCGALSPPGFALLRVALEGAFGTADGSPAPGQQLVFARTRVVVRGGLCPNTAYTFRTPFGNIPLTTDDTGGVRPNVGTTDIGCLAGTPGACDFHAALAGSLFGSAAQGGFLRSVPQPAGGYLGDGATLGPIAGGTNSNDFAVLDGSSAVVGSTTNFTTTGRIAGPVQSVPAALDFAGVATGSSSTKPLALTNLGNYPTNGALSISSAAIVPGTDATTSHPEAFSVANPVGCTALPRDGSCTVQVTFTPSAALGRQTARLQLTTTGFRTPQFITLTGSNVNANAVAQAIASPASLAFGSVRIRETSPIRLITISNPAGATAAPLVLTDITITGADSSQFTLASNTCQTGTTVDPGNSCVIGVRFAPFATGAGPMAAQVNVTSNAQTGTPAIPLTGNATGGRAAVSDTLNPLDGMPDWYMAEDGAKVVQCIDPADTGCVLGAGPTFTGQGPLHFLDDLAHLNFPDEFFYTVATSDNIDLQGCNGSAGGRAFFRSAIEGAFVNGDPAPGDQMVFGRIRMVVRGGLCPNSTYKFIHPYGETILVTDNAGAVKPNAGTDDVGCLAVGPGTVCDFTLALSSRVLGGLLRWDPAVAPAAPAGYIGDALTPHSVVGAPYAPNGVPQNSFRIEHVGINPDTHLPEDIVDGETDQWTVSGKLQGPLEADSTAVGFGAVPVSGATRTQTVTLSNTGVDPLTISTVTIAGLDAAEFTPTVNCVGQTLAAGTGTCQVSVTFDPAAIGLRTAVLRITHTGLNSPFEVGLTGIGSVGTDKPNLTFTPRSLAFAPVHAGRSSSIATVTVSNPAATQPLTINDVQITNDLGGAFRIVDNRCQPQTAPGLPTGDPGQVAGGASCQVDVVFSSPSAGDFGAKLEVVTPDFPPIAGAPDPNTLINLTGTASAANPAVSAAVDSSNGFPRWYQDGNGIRLQPCLQTTNCVLLADAGFNPANPVAFPTNFPSEFFISLADSDVVTVNQDCGNGVTATGQVTLRLALEGSFANGAPAAGDQITFGRMRVIPPRGAGGGALCPDTPYTFVTPFGVLGPITTGPANGALPGRFRVNDATFDIGCGAAPCNFADALASPVTGSFLRWDPNVAPAAPAGFLGDGATFHAVTGGTFIPAGQSQPFNGFQVLSGSSVVGETDRFAVAGQIAGPLAADRSSVAFGHQAINAGATASQTITVSNLSATPVTLGAAGAQLTGANAADFQIVPVGTTCTAGSVLPADGSCSVVVTFDPVTTGAKTATLSVASTTGQAATTVLSGTGDPAASPVVTLSPTTLGFGSVNVRVTSAAQTITVRNTGTAALNVSAVTRTGAAAADFVVTTATATPCVNVAVAPGASCTIQVQFLPSAIGLRSASITLTHNPAGASQATSSSVPVSGTGLGSILNSTQSPVKFGTVNRNATQDQTITIKNTGNAAAALSLASFSVTGTGYSVRSTTCGSLAVNNTCNVVVRFTAPNVVSTFNGTLNVTAANGVPATAQVALTATTK